MTDYNPLEVFGKGLVELIEQGGYSCPEELANHVKAYVESITAVFIPDLEACRMLEESQGSYAPELSQWDDAEGIITKGTREGKDNETKETISYLEKQLDAAYAVLESTPEQIIKNIKALGIEPIYVQKIDTESIIASIYKEIQSALGGLDPRSRN